MTRQTEYDMARRNEKRTILRRQQVRRLAPRSKFAPALVDNRENVVRNDYTVAGTRRSGMKRNDGVRERRADIVECSD